MKRATQLKVKQLLVIISFWLATGFVITVYDYLVLHSDYALGPAGDYSFILAAARNIGGGLIGGLLGGSLLVFFVNEKYQDKPYGYTILAVSISFIFIIALVAVIMGLFLVPAQTGRPISDPLSREALLDFLTDSTPIKAALVWSIVVAVTQLLLQVNKKFGYGIFWHIIRGKYNTPKEEERIFMFLDINSSTTIAERLGDETYHALLKDFFADITNPILNNDGHIYQYAGDEVIVSWTYREGIENSHCIRCFFDMKLHIQQQREKYLRRYGLVPSFKAGIHSGKVVAGEVGIIKRDITYSGDVLNTTARICNMCRDFNVELLASADLMDAVPLGSHLTVKPLGSIK
ncbi:MAG TPA: adenylate/guanylate cyclase domain-containing protein, partial [Anseongella sp.]|nr:adenylate/guanylate cyclase domain-containing protein [Anseongella sp.]